MPNYKYKQINSSVLIQLHLWAVAQLVCIAYVSIYIGIGGTRELFVVLYGCTKNFTL